MKEEGLPNQNLTADLNRKQTTHQPRKVEMKHAATIIGNRSTGDAEGPPPRHWPKLNWFPVHGPKKNNQR
jgi:hypothetical protein